MSETTTWPDELKVRVTDRDHEKGECSDPEKCAFALALIRTIKRLKLVTGKFLVSVGPGNSSIFDTKTEVWEGADYEVADKELAVYDHPESLTDGIGEWDATRGETKFTGTYTIKRK